MSESESLFDHPLPKMLGKQERYWAAAAELTGIRPLECKAIYAAGLVRHLVESAGHCFGAGLHLAAYQLASSSFEPLGSVTKGRDFGKGSDAALSAGLRFSAGLGETVDDEAAIVATTWHGGDYSVLDCIKRRHFTAHGGQNPEAGVVLDADLTIALLRHAVVGLDRWWLSLRDGSGLQQLAISQLVPLSVDNEIVFVEDLRAPLFEGAMPGGAVQYEEAWRF